MATELRERRLVALRIPSGWAVVFNNFVELDDIAALSVGELDAYLAQDVLALQAVSMGSDGSWSSPDDGLALDVSWRPAADPDGRYIVAIVRRSWEDVPLSFEHKDQGVVKNAIEMSMRLLAEGYSPEFLQVVFQDLITDTDLPA
jgi:hypothetical protein